jgi:crotonobetainyl-CoA:carnitine CoA-transferase CaiB-like acyl-CoA transferase
MTAKFEKTPGMVTTPPPRLGEHTAEVLRGIGFDDAQIGALKEKKVI